MLDENLPIYRFQPSSDSPLSTVLYFTHNGSEPSADYLIKRADPSSSKNQYALGLFDAKYASVIYAEVPIKPEWAQPTLSAAEIRAQGGTPEPTALTPETFSISLYNPDQSVAIKRIQGSWGKSDSWEFEIPERSFKLPSTSQIDQEGGVAPVSELTPKVVFRWKREGRKDMTCYMSGRSVGGKKNKEPDITVALFQGGKNDHMVTIYEPNMRRVEVEDRKGLEVAFLLSAEVIRDLYITPRQNPFNITGGPPVANGRRTDAGPSAVPPAAMSGALNNTPPSAAKPTGRRSPRAQAEIDAETKRLQAMVAQEERQARERETRDKENRDKEEQKRIKMMLEQEETERRRREAEVEKETERLRKEYGVATPGGPAPSSPPLPPRPSAGGGWFGAPVQPPRPNSVGPSPGAQQFAAPPQQANGRKKHGNPLNSLLHSGPYGGPAAAGASVSNFFGRSEEDKKKKIQKKRSVHF